MRVEPLAISTHGYVVRACGIVLAPPQWDLQQQFVHVHVLPLALDGIGPLGTRIEVLRSY